MPRKDGCGTITVIKDKFVGRARRKEKTMYQKNVWENMTPEKKKAMYAFNEGYKAFLSAAKTERLGFGRAHV